MAKNKLNQVYNIDSRHILESIPQNIEIQTTITSPPYFDMKDYGSENQVGYGQIYEDYLNDLQNIFENAGIDCLEIEIGMLVRRKKENGEYEWIIEI